MNRPVSEAELDAANPKPHVLPEDLDAQIKDVKFSQFDLLTVCVITMQNGFLVTGESACAYAENFNEEIGQRIALENAKQKMWPLLGYELKSKVHAEQTPPVETTPLERVQIELAELESRTNKLQEFVSTGKVHNLSDGQQRLILNQLQVMHAYHQILTERIEIW